MKRYRGTGERLIVHMDGAGYLRNVRENVRENVRVHAIKKVPDYAAANGNHADKDSTQNTKDQPRFGALLRLLPLGGRLCNGNRRLIGDNNGLSAAATNALLPEEIRGQHRLIITMRTAKMYCITHRRHVPA